MSVICELTEENCQTAYECPHSVSHNPEGCGQCVRFRSKSGESYLGAWYYCSKIACRVQCIAVA